MYCKDAIALVNENRSIWDEFLEAARVLKLTSHEDILERLKQLEKASEITLHTLLEWNSIIFFFIIIILFYKYNIVTQRLNCVSDLH